MNMLRSFITREDGTVAIEFGIVGSVFTLCAVGLFDVANGYYIHNRLDYAADRIARMVLIDPNLGLEAIELPDALDGLDPDFLGVEMVASQVDGTTFQTITLSYPASVFSSLMGSSVLNLSAERTVYAADHEDE